MVVSSRAWMEGLDTGYFVAIYWCLNTGGLLYIVASQPNFYSYKIYNFVDMHGPLQSHTFVSRFIYRHYSNRPVEN